MLQMALSPHLALKRRCLLLTSTTDVKVSSFNFTRVKTLMPTAHGMKNFKYSINHVESGCFFCSINMYCPAGGPVSSGCIGAIEGMFDLQGCLNVI